jgi:hypothetical protein
MRRERKEKTIVHTKKNTRPCCVWNKKAKTRKLLFVFVCICMVEILCLFEKKANEYNHHPKTGKQQTTITNSVQDLCLMTVEKKKNVKVKNKKSNVKNI